MTYAKLGDKVKAWRTASDLSIPRFAEMVATSRQNIENLEQGEVDVPRYVAKLAKAMGTTVDELIDLRRPVPPLGNATSQGSTDAAAEQSAYNRSPATSEVRTVPIYSTPPGGVGHLAGEPPKAYQTGTTTGKVGPNGYALRVRGSSMLNPHGAPSFPDGCLIFVNPDMEPENGQFIVTQLPDDGGFTFKRFTNDAGQRFLESLNPKFEMIPMPRDAPVLGVVVATGMDLI